MKTYNRIFFGFLALSFMILWACGSGGGSGGQSSSNSGSGTVAVFVTDGPADEYDHIWIRVKEVTLIPSQGDKVVIYKSYEGYELDLLAYRDEDFLLTMKKRVPAGTYEKIRLEISDIVPDGGPCSDMKLPSGKIDLNPRGTFEVEPGETLAIRLDIDANKSINISGSCNFRPVVFVDIEPIVWQRCPKVLKGVIEDLIYENEDGAIEGFVLDLGGNRGTINVYLSTDTVIFDEDGLPVGSYDFAKEETVWVRGRLDVDGNLQASEVVIGSVDSLKGTVETADDEQEKTFSLKTETKSYTVHLSGETLVLTGCDEEVDPSTIQPEMIARVFGKLSGEDNIQAIVVFLKPAEISGEIVSLEPYNDGYNLTMKVSEDGDVTVFVPKDTVYLEGDGKIEDTEMHLLCEGRQVRVLLDPDKELTAGKVIIEADSLEGRVDNIDEIDSSSLIVYDGETYVDVQVREGATISDLRDEIKPAELDDIKISDEVRCLGLRACEGDDFYAFVIFLIED
jgi:hypothetical protein